jgi:hypothetical protein
MLDIVIAFIVTATLTSAIWIYLVWKPNDNNSMGEKEDKTTEVKLPLPTRYFYCIQDRKDLPEWDPMHFAAELYREAKMRADRYLAIEFPLAMGTGDKITARRAYQLDDRNFAHLSATLNQMIIVLNNLGKSYPDALQFNHKIGTLRLEIDYEAKKRQFICATNLFPARFNHAVIQAYGASRTSPNRETITYSEVRPYFTYTEDELFY